MAARRERMAALDAAGADAAAREVASSASAPHTTGGSGGGGTRHLTQDQIHEIFDFYCNFGRSGVMTHQVRTTAVVWSGGKDGGGGVGSCEASVHLFNGSLVWLAQDSVDSFMFSKFCKECPGLLNSTLNTTGASLPSPPFPIHQYR